MNFMQHGVNSTILPLQHNVFCFAPWFFPFIQQVSSVYCLLDSMYMQQKMILDRIKSCLMKLSAYFWSLLHSFFKP